MKTVVDLYEARRIIKAYRDLDNIPIEYAKFMNGDLEVVVPDKDREEWRFCGLGLVGFLESHLSDFV